MKALGVGEGVERDGVHRDARNAEVVTDAAHTEHQRVVAHDVTRQHQRAVVVVHGVERELVSRAVEAEDGTLTVAKVMPVGERQIVDAVYVGIHAARSHLVQQRLPQVCGVLVDQYHLGPSAPCQLVAESCGERKTSGAAADDDDAVRRSFRHLHRRQPSGSKRRSSAICLSLIACALSA